MEDKRKDEKKIKIKGMDEADQKVMRTVTIMKIKLQKNAPEKKELGYQEPVSQEEKDNHKKGREDFNKERQTRKKRAPKKASDVEESNDKKDGNAKKVQPHKERATRGGKQYGKRMTFNDDIMDPVQCPPRGRGQRGARGARGRNTGRYIEDTLEAERPRANQRKFPQYNDFEGTPVQRGRGGEREGENRQA